MSPKVLIVLTSVPAEPVGGWWLPEFAHPYYKLSPHCELFIASPLGGHAPMHEIAVEIYKDDEVSQRFAKECKILWENTEKLESFVGRDDIDAIFFVGGHGPMFDLAVDRTSQALIRTFYESSRVVASICHGPAALVNVKLSDGSYLLADQEVTCLTNDEEDTGGLASDMPFKLESILRERVGEKGKFKNAAQLEACTVVSGKGGKLITGQNPASADGVAEAILQAIGVVI